MIEEIHIVLSDFFWVWLTKFGSNIIYRRGGASGHAYACCSSYPCYF